MSTRSTGSRDGEAKAAAMRFAQAPSVVRAAARTRQGGDRDGDAISDGGEWCSSKEFVSEGVESATSWQMRGVMVRVAVVSVRHWSRTEGEADGDGGKSTSRMSARVTRWSAIWSMVRGMLLQPREDVRAGTHQRHVG